MFPDSIKLSENPGNDLRLFLQKKGYSKVTVLSDENTLTHCYPLLSDTLPSHNLIRISPGEEHKTLPTCEQIWSAMTEHQLDRHSVLIVIGGGVLGDMGGFCASVFKRGIDFILLPTTLLSMADSSIGGKLGVDFKSYKNHIGSFQQPALNLVHSGFLKTLPVTELRSGFAEIIKHALISDKHVWNEIRQKPLTGQDWPTLLRHSIEFKTSVVQEDPREKGLRKILNAGHTIGHALESYFLDKGEKIMHGEAVAAGLICEAFIAGTQNLLTESERDEITVYILSIFGKLQVAEPEVNAIAALTIQDKKNKDNRILAALLDGIGKARWDCEVNLDKIVESLTF